MTERYLPGHSCVSVASPVQLIPPFKAAISHLPGQPFVLHDIEEDDEPEQSVPPFSGPTFDLV